MRIVVLLPLLMSLVLAAPILAGPLDPPAGTKILKDVPYVKDGHERQKLDLFLPPGYDKPGAKLLPLIIWVHGGGWLEGNKEGCPAVPFLRRGYAVASINYRLSQHAVWPAQIQDCRAAVRFLRAHAADYKLDADHFGVWGASAGGHLVAMLGTTADDKGLDAKAAENVDVSAAVQCVFDWFGPTDLTRLLGRGGAQNPVMKLLGGSAAAAKAASPLFFVSKSSAPLLIMHGDKDPLVPLDQSTLLEAAYKKAGVPCEFITLPGAGHGGMEFFQPRYVFRAYTFFDQYLKPKSR